MTKTDLYEIMQESGVPVISISNLKTRIWQKDDFTVFLSWGQDFILPDEFKKHYHQYCFSFHAGQIVASGFKAKSLANEFKVKLEFWIQQYESLQKL